MNMNDKISVIVPLYRTEEYLPRCLKSIQDQTYRNLEIILIDDASPDGSYKIAETFAAGDERFRLSRFESNRGAYTARNEGLKQSTGEWIAFVDSDDCLPPNALEDLIVAACREQTNMAMGGYTLFFEGTSGRKREMLQKPQVFRSGVQLQRYFLTDAKDNNYLWARLYRRYVFNGFQFPDGKAYRDLWVMPHILYAAQSCAIIDQSVYEYYLRPDSITGEKNMVTSMDIVEARLENERFIAAQYPSLMPYISDVIIEVCCFYLGRLSRAGRERYKVEWDKTVACIRDHLPRAALHTWTLKGMRPIFTISPAILGWFCNEISHMKRKGLIK